MLAISWQYLTGHAVATDYGSRGAAEWPPHPDRVFQALAAAWGEGGESFAEKHALEWLERQPLPRISCPENAGISRRSVNTFFVPVNDDSWRTKTDFGFPAARAKKGRVFPTIWVGNAVCSLIYPGDCSDDLLETLNNLCGRIVYLGHSSSLVRMWASRDNLEAVYIPSETPTDLDLRVPSEGRLQELISAYADGEKGWRRPPAAGRAFYVLAAEKAKPVIRGPWDSEFYVFRQTSGRRLDSTFSPLVADLFRRTLMSHANEEPEGLALISGHAEDGSPLQHDHACVIPLPFVDSPDQVNPYGDGHLMGLGLAMPESISADERLSVSYVLSAASNDRGQITVANDAVGKLTFELEDRQRPPLTLRASTWCRRSKVWGSVTPIVIDRMPPRTCRDIEAWDAEEIQKACVQRGLPPPSSVLLSDMPAFPGAARSQDFPAFRRHGMKRFHTHAVLVFPEPVAGPLMIGMGKYCGFGLLRPIQTER